MRVTDSHVMMASQHSMQQTYSRQESLRAWVGDRPADSERRRPQPMHDRLDVSEEAHRQVALLNSPESVRPTQESPLAGVDKEDWLRILLLQHLLGLDVTVLDTAQLTAEAEKANPPPASPSGQSRPARDGWGVDYQLHESYRESEHLHVTMGGTIKTADGQEIAFAVDLFMSRDFTMERHEHLRAGDAARPVDPLVINFAGTAADVTTTRFRFDLDADGSAEMIPALKPGSGFLALDENGDGGVTSGAQLFGPRTGDGFAELAQHDADGSGWIDAADPIFAKLRVWTKDEQGKDRLFALGQLGIGAVYVGNVDAAFEVKDVHNRSLALNQKAGLFVRENGTAGSVQQLDLMV